MLYESQYGFRKNMSTSLAILELVENITASIIIIIKCTFASQT